MPPGACALPTCGVRERGAASLRAGRRNRAGPTLAWIGYNGEATGILLWSRAAMVESARLSGPLSPATGKTTLGANGACGTDCQSLYLRVWPRVSVLMGEDDVHENECYQWPRLAESKGSFVAETGPITGEPHPRGGPKCGATHC